MIRSDELCVILLNYNSYKDTVGCIHRLIKIGVEPTAIIVVDNHSNDDSFKKLQQNKYEFNLISAPKNLGYAAGNNIGIKFALTLKAKKICVMNPDIYFESNFLKPLMIDLDQDKKIGVIGPCLRYLDSKEVASVGGTFHMYSGKSRFNHMHEEYRDYGKVNCDYISGGCMMFDSDILENVGLIPEIYFLNYEDNEWCKKISESGYKVVCDSSYYVFHKGESSIDKISGLGVYFMLRNRVLFAKRNASIFQKLLFYPFMCLVIIKNTFVYRKLSYVTPYIDGFMNKNKYEYLIK